MYLKGQGTVGCGEGTVRHSGRADSDRTGLVDFAVGDQRTFDDVDLFPAFVGESADTTGTGIKLKETGENAGILIVGNDHLIDADGTGGIGGRGGLFAAFGLAGVKKLMHLLRHRVSSFHKVLGQAEASLRREACRPGD